MTMHHLLTLVLLTGALTACTAPLQGPEADLHAIATPDPVPQVVRTVPQPAPGPSPEQGHFRAWVPRQVQPNGDEVDGHWMTVSPTPPPTETLEPVKPMPRAPKTVVGAKPSAPPQPQGPAQPQMVPQATPTPVLPTGLLRGGQPSPLRSILGGGQ